MTTKTILRWGGVFLVAAGAWSLIETGSWNSLTAAFADAEALSHLLMGAVALASYRFSPAIQRATLGLLGGIKLAVEGYAVVLSLVIGRPVEHPAETLLFAAAGAFTVFMAARAGAPRHAHAK